MVYWPPKKLCINHIDQNYWNHGQFIGTMVSYSIETSVVGSILSNPPQVLWPLSSRTFPGIWRWCWRGDMGQQLWFFDLQMRSGVCSIPSVYPKMAMLTKPWIEGYPWLPHLQTHTHTSDDLVNGYFTAFAFAVAMGWRLMSGLSTWHQDS
jgi:hypothetical protein